MSILDKISGFFGGGVKNEGDQPSEPIPPMDEPTGMPGQDEPSEREAPVITPEPGMAPPVETPSVPEEPMTSQEEGEKNPSTGGDVPMGGSM